jgi:hypothetical protein
VKEHGARLDDSIEAFGTLARATTMSPRSRLLPKIGLDYQQCIPDPTAPCNHHQHDPRAALRNTRRDQASYDVFGQTASPDRDLYGRLASALRAAMERLPSLDGSHGGNLACDAGSNEVKRNGDYYEVDYDCKYEGMWVMR